MFVIAEAPGLKLKCGEAGDAGRASPDNFH